MAAADRRILQMSSHFPALATLTFAPFSITSRGINTPFYKVYVYVCMCVCVRNYEFRHTALHMFNKARSENCQCCIMAIYINLGLSTITQTSVHVKVYRTVFKQANSKAAR